MKRRCIKLFILNLFLCLGGIAQANPDGNRCCGTWEAEAEFLWWKPCIEDLEFASNPSNRDFFNLGVVDPGAENIATFKSICPEWEPGVRVKLSSPNFCGNWKARIGYTFIQSNTSDSLEGNSIVLLTREPFYNLPPPANIGEAKAHWKADYHEWDLLALYDIRCNCHLLTPFIGVAALLFEQHLRNEFFDNAGAAPYQTGTGAGTKWHGDYWGAGIRIGLDYEYQFSNCFSFIVEAQETILAGQACSKHKEFLNTGEPLAVLTFKNDLVCQMIDGYHFKVGLKYAAQVCACAYSLKLGYEFLKWHDLPNDRQYFGSLGGSVNLSSSSSPYHGTSSSVRTVGFHGLFVGAAINF